MNVFCYCAMQQQHKFKIFLWLDHLQTSSGSLIKFPCLSSANELSPHLIIISLLTNSIESVWCNKLMAKKSLRIFLQWGNRDSFDGDMCDEENAAREWGRQRIETEPERWKI
uniref:Uncharacterized protein n=1 Tax=Glossina palpalis gambiensis TaxID=67801 RepID=A0A1B0BBJ6_9MUSC